jgi:hypothetical protein
VTVITLILASVTGGSPAVTRYRLVGRTPECSETVQLAPFVHSTDGRESALDPVASVEMTQDELTLARTAKRPSAVWATAGALERTSGAKAMAITKKGIMDIRWRRWVIATCLRRSQ